MNLIAITFIALAAALAIFTFMVWRGMSQDWLPIELKTAKLVNVEEDLIVDEPFPGRPDQVYRLKNGLHVPLELKNRDQYRIYDTDVAEISLRAWLLRKNGKKTASYGYMAINNRETDMRQAFKVELGDDRFCERLIQRYIALTQGAVAPRKSAEKSERPVGTFVAAGLQIKGDAIERQIYDVILTS